MRAVLRLGIAVCAAVLALGPASALAQNVPQATTNTPATDAIGPRELQNFSIQGTVTRPADQPPAPQPSTTPPATRSEARSAPASTRPRTTAPAPNQAVASSDQLPPTDTASNTPAQPAERTAETLQQTPPSSSVTVALPRLDNGIVRSSARAPVPASAGFESEPQTAPGSLAPEHKPPILPWLLAAVALGAGAAFLFWRNRSRAMLAGGPRFDAFSAPEPAPAPAPAPAPPRTPAPTSAPGIVSTRLRPWIDIGLQPLRCIVEDQRVTIEFELELFNSGSAPARAVLVEASMFNAGVNQDQEIGGFFGNPVGEGERIAAIAPLKRMKLRTQVVTALEHVQVFDIAGRKVFVPLIAFNALYRWSGGEGQTSVSHLLGRDTKGEKMAPFRLDLGPRVFRGVGARLLPVGVRQ